MIQRLNSLRRFLLRVYPHVLNQRKIAQIRKVLEFIDRPRKKRGPLESDLLTEV